MGNLQLSELDVVVPVVRGHAETTALGSDVEEDEHALLDGDLFRDGVSAVGVLDEPVGEADEGDLVHLAEVLEAIGDSVEQAEGPLGACVARNRHFRLFVVVPLRSQLGWSDGVCSGVVVGGCGRSAGCIYRQSMALLD